MEFTIFEAHNRTIAEIVSGEVVIDDAQDALDIMVNAHYQGAESVILPEMNLGPEFFELQTGMAG